MIGPRPVAPARWLIGLTVAMLPGDARDRYREEFRTELAELGWVAQLPQACSLVIGALPLRNALSERDLPDMVVEKKDWRCRIGRHSYVVRENDNAETRGVGYLQCVRCGKHKDPPRYEPVSQRGAMGWG